MNPVLAVGAVIDAKNPAAWVCLLLARIQQYPALDLQAVVVVAHADKQHHQQTSMSAFHRLGQWLLQSKIDKSLFNQDPWESQDLPAGINLVERTDAAVALSNCQIVLNLCHSDIPEDVVSDLTTSIWSAEISSLDTRVEQALLRRDPLNWIYLWSQTTGNKAKAKPAKLIASHALPTESYSITDWRKSAYFCLPSLFSSRLNWLAQYSDLLDIELDNPGICCELIKEERAVSAQQAVLDIEPVASRRAFNGAGYLKRVLSIWARQTLKRLADRLWVDQWQLAAFDHGEQSASLIDEIGSTNIEDYSALPCPKNLIRADPHVLEQAGNTHILFEEMATGGSKAHIASAKLDGTGKASDFKTVLKEDLHLSYPFLFSHEGVAYMIPETASKKTVTLYRANDFPQHWEVVGDLLTDIDAADSTIIHFENRWWLFTNSQSHRVVDERDELLLYFAEKLTGPWQAHPLNPVLTGVDRARMAGPLISENGILHRPSQYGAVRYGRGINLNRIERMDTTHYQETPVARILPKKDSKWSGCHSITRAQGLTIVDRVCRQRR
ncbi:MAG: hypothetical protein AB8B79_08000 [Granulosicoccus sp.]